MPHPCPTKRLAADWPPHLAGVDVAAGAGAYAGGVAVPVPPFIMPPARAVPCRFILSCRAWGGVGLHGVGWGLPSALCRAAWPIGQAPLPAVPPYPVRPGLPPP